MGSFGSGAPKIRLKGGVSLPGLFWERGSQNSVEGGEPSWTLLGTGFPKFVGGSEPPWTLLGTEFPKFVGMRGYSAVHTSIPLRSMPDNAGHAVSASGFAL